MNMLRRKEGMIFFTTLILLLTVVLICSGLSVLLLRNTYTVNNIKYAVQAKCLAEAGAEEALKKIYENDFNPPGYPKTDVPLGGGTYSVSILTYPGDSNRKLIKSTGTVKGVSGSVAVQVYNNSPDAFNYAVLSESTMRINWNSVVTGDVHSNSTNTAPSNPAVLVGGLGAGRVNGTASACGDVLRWPSNGIITTEIDSASRVELPPFGTDAGFFPYYANLAAADGKVYSPGGFLHIQTFNSNPCTGANRVVYVNGNVILDGPWEMTGCIVATGFILFTDGAITQHKYLDLPAFMSKDSFIWILAPASIEGMIYAGGTLGVSIYSSTTINGSVYTRGPAFPFLSTNATINYVRPNPPGLSSNVSVLSKSE